MVRVRFMMLAAVSALLLLTSVGLGLARGQMPVAGHVVICGAFGLEHVALDARGTPVKAQGHCPDCAGLMLAAATPQGTATAEPVASGETLLTPWPRLPSAAREATLPPPARGPPFGRCAA